MAETPSLPEVINEAIESKLYQLHTAMPAVVVKYDHSKQLADVQPAIKRKYSSGTVVSLPIVTNCPVVFPRSQGFSLTYPLSPGDTVLLIFSERSIDKWNAAGGTQDPMDPRRHHLSDGIVIPGLYPQNNTSTDAQAGKVRLVYNGAFIELGATIKIQLGSSSVELTSSGVTIDASTAQVKSGAATLEVASGKFKLQGASAELLDLVSQIADQLAQATTTVLGNPTPLNNAAQFATIKSKVDAIKG